MDQITVERLKQLYLTRLKHLHLRCEEVAKRKSALTGSAQMPLQSMFSMQPFSDSVQVPMLRMQLGEVKVEIRPHGIEEQINGKSFGVVVVDRTLMNGGRMNGYTCWTDLNTADDDGWYLGATGNKTNLLEEITIEMWLKRSGPMPLF